MKMYAAVPFCLFTSFLYSSETESSMPKKNPLLNAYPTLNGYGSCFEPIDPMSTTFAEDINKHRKNNETTNVCEIGVGFGLLARSVLEKRFENNLCSYTGIDLDEKHLDIATQQMSELLRNNATVTWNPTVGDFPDVTNNMQQITNHFTQVGAFCVLHFSSPEKLQKTLCSIETMLAKGGKAYLSTLRADTPIYGPFMQDYYRKQQEHGVELSGYIEDFPQFIDDLLESDGLPEKIRQIILVQKENSGTQHPKKHLFLTIDDLTAQVKKHTKLIIESSEIVTRMLNDTQVPYIGMILKKE